ncbi:uncharacterized protein AMSG_10493 [Thecamonas trahens ATCC 50062]|uniref:PARP catalytic domain-containing protein n=1 Tax=Thecamonas trahens ATCC 50062 TaxID=461836 RepID=A0A0L0DQE7_THETB|nr:hypothetical protein AMSG_10493 [Thecamonas trahens ATCC 50062]KNC54495.1 hypothetical protein AMSG_10493 [Thecamonas trahens ATCC 50062]|eukprot:XP_013753648.1 hypothetical protein AMSG_10493 [Thecamonas trahens ATCC 50062]
MVFGRKKKKQSQKKKKKNKRRRSKGSSSSSSYGSGSGSVPPPAADPLALRYARGSLVLKRILSKQQYGIDDQALVLEEMDSEEEYSSSSGGKGKKSKKSKKSKKGKKGKGHHDKIGNFAKANRKVNLRLLPREDAVCHAVVETFKSSLPSIRVDAVVDVDSPAVRKFARAKDKVAKKRPLLARNNLIVRRLFFGARPACRFSLGGELELCSLTGCQLCAVLRGNGYPVSAIEAPVGVEASGSSSASDDGHTGIIFSTTAEDAARMAAADASVLGKTGRVAVVSCLVVVGESKSVWSADEVDSVPPKGFDSVTQEPADAEHFAGSYTVQRVVVGSADAAMPVQVVVFGGQHGLELCAACGRSCAILETQDAVVSGEYGKFCSADCEASLVAMIDTVEARMTQTDTKLKVPAHWSVTTAVKGSDSSSASESEENDCDLIDVAGSVEAAVLYKKLSETLEGVTFQGIYRIQSPHLHAMYRRQLKTMTKTAADGDVDELLLFSGCHGLAPDEIYNSLDGFDFKLVSGDLGRAWHFGPASFADRAAMREANGFRTILVAKVALGACGDVTVDPYRKLPPLMENPDVVGEAKVKSKGSSSKKGKAKKSKKGKTVKRRYDTITAAVGEEKLYAMFTNKNAYPAYVITYTAPDNDKYAPNSIQSDW